MQPPTRTALAATLAALALLAAPARVFADAPAGPPVDGIRCDQMEGALFHIHQHLTILARGKAVEIPDDVGRPVAANCLYWLHTHTSDGLIHVESPVYRTFNLGQLFDVWGQTLSATNVAGTKLPKGQLRVYVNGTVFKGNPRSVELTQHTDIAIEAGPPFRAPAPFTAWNGQ